MKKLCTNFLITVLFLQVIFLSTHILAEQGGTRRNPVADNAVSFSGKKHDLQKGLTHMVDEYCCSLVDPFHQMIGNKRKPCSIQSRRDELKAQSNHVRNEKGLVRKSSVANTSADTWRIETVDAPKYFTDFYSRAIAVDASNHPHIAYGGDHLYYAYNDGNTWNYQTVDLSPGVGDFASIALDTSGKIHISYSANKGDFKYATNSSGPWVMATIDNSRDVGAFNSVAVDTFGRAHISYWEWIKGDLKYATNATGSWVTEIVNNTGVVGQETSLAVNTFNKVHISYYDNTQNGLEYVTNASGSWVTTTVTGGGRGNSIALDALGKVHISYFGGYPNGGLKYATNSSGVWARTTVDSNGTVGLPTSIAVDKSNNVHISYYDWTNGDLKYATNASGSWVTITVDNSGDVGLFNSVAVDTFGKVHISYYDRDNQDLKYATNSSGSWITVTVDSAGDVGWDNSIALDTSGKVHISYFDGYPNDDLKYATNISGSWVATTVDSGGNVGTFNSIAVDTLGKVHISYYDWTNRDLKYATNAPSETIPPTVVSTNPVNDATDIAINTAITAAFSESMDASTINDSTFTINNGVTGTIGYDDATKTATFTPSSNLTYSTTYTATITTGVKDLAGNPMIADYIWSFTTAPEPDTTPPVVISTNPLHNAVNVAINTVVTATFSEPIDETTINTSSFTIGGVTGTVSYNPATKMATFTPSTNLDNVTSYTATITTDVMDNAGNHIAENYSWSFTAIPDAYHWIANPANGHLYKLIDGGDWHSSENEANAEEAHLVTINNEDEQTWLSAIFGAKARYWIGYTDEAEEGNWKWVSGESSGYTNWNTGEPSNSGNCEDYGIMRPDGKWNDVGPCSPIWTDITTALIEKVTCEPEKMLISDVRLKLKKKQSGEVTVMITDNEGCQVEGIEVKAKVGSISKQFISVLPKSGITDDKGQAIFTITTRNKTGNAKVTFRAGKLKKTLVVRVIR